MWSRWARWTVLLLPVCAGACRENAETRPPSDDDGAGGGGGALPLCDQDEIETPAGCIAVGIGADDCGDGFVHDGEGCTPLLPDMPCPPGSRAVPGDTMCIAFDDCGEGTYGDIAGATLFVDAATATPGPGSEQAPFDDLFAAIAAAPVSAKIAVAAGSYTGTAIMTKQLHIAGRCAAMVKIIGSGPFAPFDIRNGASGTVISGMDITGPARGVMTSGATDLLLSELWIHDTGLAGVRSEVTLGDSSLTLDSSLIEGASGYGLFTSGGHVVVIASAIRNTAYRETSAEGRAVNAQVFQDTGAPASLSISGSRISNNHQVGVFVGASSAEMLDSVVESSGAGSDDLSRGLEIIGFGALRSTIRIDSQRPSRQSHRRRERLRAQDVELVHVVVSGGAAGSGRPLWSRRQRPRHRRPALRADRRVFALGLGRQRHLRRRRRRHCAERRRARHRQPLHQHAVRRRPRQHDGHRRSAHRALCRSRHHRHQRPRVAAGNRISDIATLPDGSFGDGVTVVTELHEGSASIGHSHIERSARAGISLFGARGLPRPCGHHLPPHLAQRRDLQRLRRTPRSARFCDLWLRAKGDLQDAELEPTATDAVAVARRASRR